MHLQARVYVKTALIYLFTSVLLGALLLANAELQFWAGIGALQPVFYHLLMLGWATQLIAGVAMWMFPVLSREQPRGDERLGWFTYAALNSGLILRLIAEPLDTVAPHPFWASVLVVSGIAQMLAIWVLVLALWPRVKGRAEPSRMREGER